MNSHLLDGVRVDYFGSPTPLNKLALVSVDGRDLIVRPFDLNDASAIMKAIITSGLGLSPQRAFALLRVNIPPLTGDRRRELSKVAKTFAEETRVAMRNVRRDALRDAKSLVLPEDDQRHLENELEALVKCWLARVDDDLAAKAKDISGEDDHWRPS